ncbi:hypothetical protein scyTo_0000453 [Scyliorhinus torazame]|uniref:Uncharacterized protein n=1 Tax=Scyliorhinus torazame TaxID=75743 RepID=A0A401NXV6_SCYTO|nr:hypothetical protein [Scyliorhinus torazame]
MQWYKLNNVIRNPRESVAVFMACLHRMAKFCSFGDSLLETLKDRLVWGFSDMAMQRRLLASSQAIQIAQEKEGTDRGVQKLQAMEVKASET